MSEYSELIKNFDKIRDYMRDFFIYGYKTRSDFALKSPRTYDNEKRRIESWLGDYIRFDNSKKGKSVSIGIDSRQLGENPLYKAYKSKSFTDNDICLHFFLLDVLKTDEAYDVEQITDIICDRYSRYFEPQTIRLKLREYVSEGIVRAVRSGKKYMYSISTDYAETFCCDWAALKDSLRYFSQVLPFGVAASFLMDQSDIKNDIFLFKHNYIVHTLEDNILAILLEAMHEKRRVEIDNFGKKKTLTAQTGVPVQISVSLATGRRYLIMYVDRVKRFASYRLDYIRSVKINDVCSSYDDLRQKCENNIDKCWGITFGSVRSSGNYENLKMTLHIDEKKESFITQRLMREGRNGTVVKTGENTFMYTAEIFDAGEMMNWIKSFTGRIESIESDNKTAVKRFRSDIKRMYDMYHEEE
ncbi:MAG: WYL domain-containing protein [Oscillospiraceae bacterium]|nr:WYL domain-containing protein [Oscillospiraceae bacterium]